MYTLYVGSPNDTHQISDELLQTIKSVTSEFFESYTYVRARGVFQDTEEDTVVITIAQAKKEEVYALGEKLRSLLRQDGVAVEHNGKYERLITE